MIAAVWKREFRSLMHHLVGYGFMAALLLFCGIFIAYYNFTGGSTDIAPALSLAERYAFPVLIPLLCMRSMASDCKQHTDMFYLSLPGRTWRVILGKYLALLTVFAIPCAVLALYPLLFALYGRVHFAGAYTAILAFFLLGAALMALCMFISSLTDHAWVAALVGMAVLVALYFLPLLSNVLPAQPLASWLGYMLLALLCAGGAYLLTRRVVVSLILLTLCVVPLTALYLWQPLLLEGHLPLLVVYLSPFAQYEYMALYGLLDLCAMLMFVSYALLFVVLTIQRADRKRYA